MTWKDRLREALGAGGDARERLRPVPKTDLHAHLLLSMPRAVLEQWATGPITPPPAIFRDFAEFNTYIRATLVPHMRGKDRIRALTRAALERLAAEGVVFAELSVELLVPGIIGISMAEYGEMLREEQVRIADRLVVTWDAGLNRELPVADIHKLLKSALAAGFLGSIDLYGDERARPAGELVEIYREAKDHGLKLKVHAGELCGPESVRAAVEVLGAQAVQHGVRAVEDPGLLELLAERGTVLNVCPTSNERLGIVPRFAEHPLRRLLDAGVRVTVNSDDYAIFDADVTGELIRLRDDLGLTPAEIERIVANGLLEAPAELRSRYGL